MTCYNCTPIPRPGYHAIQAIIHKGIPYCTECGKDVTCELDVEKICGGASQQAVEANMKYETYVNLMYYFVAVIILGGVAVLIFF